LLLRDGDGDWLGGSVREISGIMECTMSCWGLSYTGTFISQKFRCTFAVYKYYIKIKICKQTLNSNKLFDH
jgi:hypothetical protein